jgi:hypothetical protein
MAPIGPGGDIYLQPTNMQSVNEPAEPDAPPPDNVIPLRLRQLAQDGKDGVDGDPGADGRGIAGARLSAAGDLLLTYSDGMEQNVGRVKAEPAPAPKGMRFVRDSQGRVVASELT